MAASLYTAQGAALPRLVERSEFETAWTGELILLTKQFSPSSLANRFDLRWFLSAVHRYRYALSEVLVASFFLQMLGLVSPLFFQVVVDKVLVHRGLSTLDVLMIGLAIVSLFEVTLGALRTYVFSHTTNRIDVELGARLFDHLLALPLGYFANRRVGNFGRTGTRAGKYAQFYHRFRADPDHRSVFHVYLPRGHVSLHVRC